MTVCLVILAISLDIFQLIVHIVYIGTIQPDCATIFSSRENNIQQLSLGDATQFLNELVIVFSVWAILIACFQKCVFKLYVQFPSGEFIDQVEAVYLCFGDMSDCPGTYFPM